MTLSKRKNQEKTIQHSMPSHGLSSNHGKVLTTLLKPMVMLGFLGVLLWAIVYPFWVSPQISIEQTQVVDKAQLRAPDVISESSHGLSSENILTAGIDPFAPKFIDDYPIPDFASFSDVTEKKTQYFNFIRHFAEQNNAILLQKRDFIQKLNIKLRVNNNALSWDDFVENHLNDNERTKVAFLISEYRIKENTAKEVLNRLLLRVHTVPVELVQVQTANESGWGTSRFATQGYNYFGLWCYRKGCGFVPSQRNEGASHEVAKFNSPAEGMYQYIRNLNRNRAYRELRSTRAELFDDPNLSKDSYARAMALTHTLGAYSERGDEYIDELQSMLRVNKPFFESSDNREK